jgi:BirA family transcriptional regulator, biotin operon repressor / biotin---[acetyl-CoA-carboxylase] ligase
MESRAHPYGRIAQELAGSPFSAITYVAETDSTNADAARLLGSEDHLGRSIVAEHQRRGQGRNGRSWTSLPGTSLLVTTILPRSVDAAHVWSVPFWAALAVRGALSKRGVRATLHWPNDLLIEGRGKVAGILCTSRITAGTAWVACGVGINVRRHHGGQTAINPPPAFCDDVAKVDRAQLLFSVLREYETALGLLADPARTAELWEGAAGLPGMRYRIVKDGEAQPFEATALRLAAGGELVVERGDGRIESVSFADARALR